MKTVAYGGATLDFASVGDAVTLYPQCVFIAPERIHIGSHVIVSEFTWIHGGIATVLGNFIHLANHSSIAGGGVCIVEDFSGWSAGGRIVTGTELVKGEGLVGPMIPPAFRAVRRSFVHLRKHVMLGTNVVVHPGVTIGEGAIIGSGSVVTKDVEPWTISVGSPARVVAKRESATIKALESRLYETAGVEPFDPTPFLGLKTDHIQLPTAL